MKQYPCQYIETEDYPGSWVGSWELIGAGTDYEELKICGRGSCYHVVLGYYSRGNYLFIPDIDIGCALGSLKDVFWNYERLSRLLGETDAITISRGLSDFAEND